MNCIALDDEPMALEIIRSHCEQLDYVNLAKCFTQASKARAYLRKHPVDLLLLDIEMPDINGISFYKSLDNPIMVIFTTAYSNYAVTGFEVDAIDYLMKPITFERFKKGVQKAYDYNQAMVKPGGESASYIYVRSNYSLVRVVVAGVLYLEKMDDYIKIHRIGEAPIYTLMSMKNIIAKLPKETFKRVHRSYAVNLDHISEIRTKEVVVGDQVVPIGRTYRGGLSV